MHVYNDCRKWRMVTPVVLRLEAPDPLVPYLGVRKIICNGVPIWCHLTDICLKIVYMSLQISLDGGKTLLWPKWNSSTHWNKVPWHQDLSRWLQSSIFVEMKRLNSLWHSFLAPRWCHCMIKSVEWSPIFFLLSKIKFFQININNHRFFKFPFMPIKYTLGKITQIFTWKRYTFVPIFIF